MSPEKFHDDIPTSPEVKGAHTLNFKPKLPNFKFSRLQFLVDTFPVGMCASKAWSTSSDCKNLRAQRPLRAEILCPEKCPLRFVNMHLYNFFVCGPKFTRFLSSNVWGDLVDQLLYRFSICRLFPGIFAIKVEKKWSEIWTFFAIPNIRGGSSRNCTHVITPALRHVAWKISWGYSH